MSRPEDHFFFPRVPVHLVSLDDALEPLTLRSVLESMGASVTLHLPGTPHDFLCVLAQQPAPKYLVISGHGTEHGFEFGEYGPEIDTSMLKGTALPPQVIQERVSLKGTVVFSTACLSGTPDMARAMLAGGAAAYVAPNDYPDGSDTVLFLNMLFHGLLERELDVPQALACAHAFDPEFGMFQLHTPQ